MDVFRRLFSLFACFVLSGCAAFNDMMTPSLTVTDDPFDNAVVIAQEPVPATSSLSDQPNLLGFHWKSLAPNLVVFTVSIPGSIDITDLQFNADGQRIKGLVPLGKRTARDRSATTVTSEERISGIRSSGYSKSTKIKTVRGTPVRSRRSFVTTCTDFEKIARSRKVVMRVFTTDSYATSIFGTESGALINAKFPPFLEEYLRRGRGQRPSPPTLPLR